MPKRVNIEIENNVLSLYFNDKLNTIFIANKLNLNVKTVCSIIKRNGLKARNNKLNAEIEKEIISLYNNPKLSSVDIADKFGITYATVNNVIHRNGGEIKNISLTNQEIESIKNMYIERKSSRQIAKIMDTSKTTILRILKDLNVSSCDRLPNNLLSEYSAYKLAVRRVTNKQPLHTLKNFDKRGRAGTKNAYNLDHKFSKKEGFNKKINPEIIGHISNLHYITWEENIYKSNKCLLSIDELIENYNNNE